MISGPYEISLSSPLRSAVVSVVLVAFAELVVVACLSLLVVVGVVLILLVVVEVLVVGVSKSNTSSPNHKKRVNTSKQINLLLYTWS